MYNVPNVVAKVLVKVSFEFDYKKQMNNQVQIDMDTNLLLKYTETAE